MNEELISDLKEELSIINQLINKHGFNAFEDYVGNGAFYNVALSIIHPEPELESIDNFEVIQRVFINTYV